MYQHVLTRSIWSQGLQQIEARALRAEEFVEDVGIRAWDVAMDG